MDAQPSEELADRELIGGRGPVQVLVFADWYLPGIKGGGPIRSLANLFDALVPEFAFRLITRDRDAGDTRSYDAVPADVWNHVGNTSVYYASPRQLSLLSLLRLIRRVSYDVVYLNSVFSRLSVRVLILRRLGLIPRAAIIASPRGECAVAALGVKPLRKRLYLLAAKCAGLYKGVCWCASSSHEVRDIERTFSPRAPVTVSGSFTRSGRPPLDVGEADCVTHTKRCGELRAVIIGRVSPIKNISGALRALEGVIGDVQLDIYGPLEDLAYWSDCRTLIARLPRNVTVRYGGTLQHEQVMPRLASADLLLLLTQGENYGHAIAEAFLAGCPVLISDKTPWRQLVSRGCGWDVPLADIATQRRILQLVTDMGPEEYAELRKGASRYARSVVCDGAQVEQARLLFRTAARVRSCEPGTARAAVTV